MFRTPRLLWFALVLVGIPEPARTQGTEPVVDPSVFQEMEWRSIGPFRGGRSVASVGVASEPMTYYMGTVGGGVWKTTDAGITWDKFPTASSQPPRSVRSRSRSPTRTSSPWDVITPRIACSPIPT